MSASAVIRAFQVADQAAIFALHSAALQALGIDAIGGPWDDDLRDVQASYLDQGGAFLVAIVDGQLVGMGALARIDRETAEIKRMRIAPDYQGQGIGRRILMGLEQKAGQLGFTRLVLDTSTQQLAAQALYESHGYSQTGTGMQGPFKMIYYEKLMG